MRVTTTKLPTTKKPIKKSALITTTKSPEITTKILNNISKVPDFKTKIPDFKTKIPEILDKMAKISENPENVTTRNTTSYFMDLNQTAIEMEENLTEGSLINYNLTTLNPMGDGSEIEREEEEFIPKDGMKEEGKRKVASTKSPSATTQGPEAERSERSESSLMNGNEEKQLAFKRKLIEKMLKEQCFIEEGDLSCESKVGDLICFGFGYIDCNNNNQSNKNQSNKNQSNKDPGKGNYHPQVTYDDESSSVSLSVKRDERSARMTSSSTSILLDMYQNILAKEPMIHRLQGDNNKHKVDVKSCKLSQSTLKCDPWPMMKHCTGSGYCKPSEPYSESDLLNAENTVNGGGNSEEVQYTDLIAFISIPIVIFLLIGLVTSYYFT